MSDEEFKQAREEQLRWQDEQKLLREDDPVEAEHMAYEMNPLTRADERFRVQDPVEAEHMAHAMDPHYERASAIDGVKERTDKDLNRAIHSDEDGVVSVEGYDQADETTKKAASSEMDSWTERVDGLIDESTALGGAASSARKAGDAHGEQVSKVYRHKKKSDGA